MTVAYAMPSRPAAAEVRCPHCGRLMARQLRGSAYLCCPRCRAMFAVATDAAGTAHLRETRPPQTDTRKPWERDR